MTNFGQITMRSFSVKRLGFVLVAGLMLSACGNVKQQLGFTREAPDEFTVLSRAPLTLPPDFALRPPKPGAVRPQEGTQRDQAREALIGKKITAKQYARQLAANTELTPGEKVLLTKSGAYEADENIRALVDAETTNLALEKASFTDHLVFWEDRSYKGTAVDANKETRRIQENMALGKSLADGEPPTIERQTKALFEGIF